MNQAEQTFGLNVLESITEAPNFNEWMYQTIRPYLHGDILEVGSGIGNISSYAIRDGKSLTLSDYDPGYVSQLKEKFSSTPNVKNIIELNLAKNTFEEEFLRFAGAFDTIFLLNVLEHIDNDKEAVANLQYLLKPGGRLIILVPSYTFLFSNMDHLLGHYRRYSPSDLKNVVKINKLAVTKTFHFNALGIAGWCWYKLFKNAAFSKGKMTLFNKLVPVGKVLDKLLMNKVGLSVIIVATKPHNS